MKTIKSCIGIFLCLVILIGVFAFNTSAVSAPTIFGYKFGDVDMNDEVNLADIILLRNYTMNGLQYDKWWTLWLGDLDMDGSINLSDIVFLRSIILEQRTMPRVGHFDVNKSLQLKRDWVRKYPDVKIDNINIRYYGTYNDIVAFMIRDEFHTYPLAEGQNTIDGVVFYYNDGRSIYAWHEGDFYALPYAYEQKWITKEELKDIAYFHRVTDW